MEEANAPSHEPPTSHEGTKPVSPLQETSLDEEASYYEDEEEYEYDEDEEEGEEFDDTPENADDDEIDGNRDRSNHHRRDSNNDDDHANDGSRPPVLRASTFCNDPESVAPTVTVSPSPALPPTPSHTAAAAPAADNDQRGNGHTNRRRSSETGGDSSVVESPRTRQPSRVAVHDHNHDHGRHDHATSHRGNNGMGDDDDDSQGHDPFSQESPPLPPTDQERLDYFSLTFERMQRVVACGAEFVETAMRDGGALDGTVPAAVPMPRNHRTGTTHAVGGGVRGGGGGSGAASSGAPIPTVFKATSSPPSVPVPTPKSAGVGVVGPRPLSGGPERKTSGGDLRAKQQSQLNADLSFEWERDAIRAAAAAALPFNHGQMRAHSPRPGHQSHGSVQSPPATHGHQHPPQQNAGTNTGAPGAGAAVGVGVGGATSVGSGRGVQSPTGVVGTGQQRSRAGIPTIDSEDTRPQSANGHGTGRPMSSGGPSAAVASDVAGSIETPLSGPRSAAEACAYCALDVANALGDIVEAITDRTSRPPLETNSSPDENPVNGKSGAAGRGGVNVGDQGLLTQTSTLSPAAVAAKTSAIPTTANAQQGRGNKGGKQNDDDGEAVLEQAEEWLAHQDQMRGAHGECDRLVLASASVIQGLIGLVVSGKRKIATQAATLSFLAQQPESVQGTAADVTMSLGSVSAGAGALAAIGGLPAHTFITDTASANAAEGSSGRVGSPHHRPGSPYSRPLSPTQAALSARGGGSDAVEPPRALSPTAVQRPTALDEMDMSGMMSARSYQGAGLEALGGFVGGGPVYASAEQVEAYRRHVQVRNVLAASAAPIAQTQQYSVRIEPTQGQHAPGHHLPQNRSQQDTTNDGQFGGNEFGDDGAAALNPGEYVGRALSPRHARPGTAGEGQRKAKVGMAQRPTSPLTRPASRLDQAKLGTSVIQPGSASQWRNADEPSEKQRRAEAVIAALEPRPGSALAKKLSEQASGQASAGAAQMGVALGDAPYGHTQVRPATVTAAVDREVSKLHQALDCTKASQFECDWRDLEGDTTVTDRRNALKDAKNADKILLKHLDKDRRDYVMFKGLMRRREDLQAPGLRSAKDLAGRMSDIVSSTASQYGSSQLVFSYSDEQNNPNPTSANSANPKSANHDQSAKPGDKSAAGIESGKHNAGRRPKSGTPSVGTQEQSGAPQTADAASYQNYMRNVAAGIFVGGGGGLGDGGGDAPFLGTLGTGGLIEEMDEFKKSQTAHGRAVATTLPPPSTSPKWRTSSDPRPPEWKRHSRHAAGPLVDKARSRPGSSAATRGGRPASRSARELPDLSENDVSVMGVIATLKDSVRSGSGGRSKAQNTRTLGRVPSAGSTRGGGGGGLGDASFVSSSGIGGLSGVGTGVVTSTPASVPSTEKPQRELSSMSGISQELAQLRDLSAVSILSTPNDESGTGAKNGNGNNGGAKPNPKRTSSSAGARRGGGGFSGGGGGGGLPPTGQGRPNTATRATAPNVGGGGRAHGASFSEGSSGGGGGPGRAKSFKDFVEAQRRSATPQPSTAELAGDIASGRTVTMVIGSVRR